MIDRSSRKKGSGGNWIQVRLFTKALALPDPCTSNKNIEGLTGEGDGVPVWPAGVCTAMLPCMCMDNMVQIAQRHTYLDASHHRERTRTASLVPARLHEHCLLSPHLSRAKPTGLEVYL